MTTNTTTSDPPFIPVDLAIQAMRDSGYKNTAYALAELIDNSFQANGRNIDVFCIEEREQIKERSRKRLKKIAVLDDGDGMSASILQTALQFGNGTRLNDRSGIGRFGMGLPNASISQAGRLDIWSWQNGPDNAMHTYLDVEEIRQKLLVGVPYPSHDPVPAEWRARTQTLSSTGTLVVWTNLSAGRLTWKGAKSTLDNTGRLVGRIYRKFIRNGDLHIRLIGGEDSDLDLKSVNVNDPMYLITTPTMPIPFNEQPMFELVSEIPITVELEEGGPSYTIMTRFSVATPETIVLAGTAQRGETVYGKDAASNIGLSLLRAGRELVLDPTWTIPYDPRERWWGCEVEFPADLDEVFGVTNNKQAATTFTELARQEWSDLAEVGETRQEVILRLREEKDPKGVLLELSQTIKDNLSQIRSTIVAQGRGKNSKKPRHPTGDSTEIANDKWKQREMSNPTTNPGDKPSEADVQKVAAGLAEQPLTVKEKDEIVARVVSGDLQVMYIDKELGSSGDLFTIFARGPFTEVILNRLHPAFTMIFDTVSADDDLDSLSSVDLQDRLLKAQEAIKLLFVAWARMEREDPLNRRTYERVRESWGKLARDFLEPDSSFGMV